MLTNKRKTVNVHDIDFAIKAHNKSAFYKPLSLKTVEMITEKKNATRLPKLGSFMEFHSIIPEQEFLLTQPNFHIYDEEIEMNLKERMEKTNARKRKHSDELDNNLSDKNIEESMRSPKRHATEQEMSKIDSPEVRMENFSCQSFTEKQDKHKQEDETKEACNLPFGILYQRF